MPAKKPPNKSVKPPFLEERRNLRKPYEIPNHREWKETKYVIPLDSKPRDLQYPSYKVDGEGFRLFEILKNKVSSLMELRTRTKRHETKVAFRFNKEGEFFIELYRDDNSEGSKFFKIKSPEIIESIKYAMEN